MTIQRTYGDEPAGRKVQIKAKEGDVKFKPSVTSISNSEHDRTLEKIIKYEIKAYSSPRGRDFRLPRENCLCLTSMFPSS